MTEAIAGGGSGEGMIGFCARERTWRAHNGDSLVGGKGLRLSCKKARMSALKVNNGSLGCRHACLDGRQRIEQNKWNDSDRAKSALLTQFFFLSKTRIAAAGG